MEKPKLYDIYVESGEEFDYFFDMVSEQEKEFIFVNGYKGFTGRHVYKIKVNATYTEYVSILEKLNEFKNKKL